MVLLAATFVEPIVGLVGLGTTLVALFTAWLLRLPEKEPGSGLLTFNSVLVGLGVGAMVQPTLAMFLLVPVAGAVSVLLTSGLSWLMAKAQLPSLTLPFIFSIWAVHALAQTMSGMALYPEPWEPSPALELLPQVVATFFQSLGALFFIPRHEAGILVAVALLVFSRTGFLLSSAGFLVAYAVSTWAGISASAPLLQNVGFNLMLVALALGSVYFKPTWASALLALVASVAAASVALTLAAWAPYLGLSPLTLPFVLTVLTVLLARKLH